MVAAVTAVAAAVSKRFIMKIKVSNSMLNVLLMAMAAGQRDVASSLSSPKVYHEN